MADDDIVRQVLAAIEATEQDARDAKNDRSGVWHHVVTPGGQNKVVDDLGYTVTGHYHDDSAPWWTCPHIARNDPDAVLRRCAADRRRIERHQLETATDGRYEGSLICVGCSVGDDDWFDRPFPCPDFLDLADSYGVAPATDPADTQETNR